MGVQCKKGKNSYGKFSLTPICQSLFKVFNFNMKAGASFLHRPFTKQGDRNDCFPILCKEEKKRATFWTAA